MNGIENVSTRVDNQTAIVTFDDAGTDAEAMKKALQDEQFSVEKVEVLQEEGSGMM